MKRLFLILGFILMLFLGCNKTNDTVTITTDRDLYTPAMSSAEGITLIRKFETEKSYENLVYHWETNEDEFIGLGKEVKNQGESVVWSSIENDKVIDIKKSFNIKLEVIGSESKRVLAAAKLTITFNNGFYEVKK